MEGGGWERPLEEKMDLEKQESGENWIWLNENSVKIFFKGLNPSQKLPLPPIFQIQLLKWSDQWEVAHTHPPSRKDTQTHTHQARPRQGGNHWGKKTIKPSSACCCNGLWSDPRSVRRGPIVPLREWQRPDGLQRLDCTEGLDALLRELGQISHGEASQECWSLSVQVKN